MNNQKVVVFGKGQNAEVAYRYLSADSDHKIVAFTADSSHIGNDENYLGLPLVPFSKIEELFSPTEYRMFLPISFYELNRLREHKYTEAKNKGYKLISYVHSSCIKMYDSIGENCCILDNNTLQPGVKIGNNVVIWSNNHIGHHSTIEDNVFISSGVIVSGSVNLGRNSFVGVNSTIRDRINIGANSIIGAGSLILKNVPEKSVISRGGDIPSSVTSDKIRLV